MFSAGSLILIVDQFGVFIGYLWIHSGLGEHVHLHLSNNQLLILLGQCLHLQCLCSCREICFWKWHHNCCKVEVIPGKHLQVSVIPQSLYNMLNYFWLVALQGKNAISIALQWLLIIRAMHRIKVHLCERDTFSNIHNSVEEVFLSMKFCTSIQSVSEFLCVYMNKATH